MLLQCNLCYWLNVSTGRQDRITVDCLLTVGGCVCVRAWERGGRDCVQNVGCTVNVSVGRVA